MVIHLISWLSVIIYCNCAEKESEPHSDIQGRLPFIMTSATSRKYPRRWFYVVIRPKSWLYVLVRGYTTCSSLHVSTSYQKKQRWLCVHGHGYMSHVVVMRGYTWLYTASVPKRCPNHIVTSRSCTRHHDVSNWSKTQDGGFMWLYNPRCGYTTHSSPGASASYQEKPRVVYVSVTMVIRLKSWLCVVIRGYVLHMYWKGVRTT